ncbi:hypothetical protein AFM40_003303 [Escherichia coli]|nr:hypothetical protein [Escherichia coli]EFJ5341875.1 hypothetical protein [Escherichia coli]HBB0223092.1 hypothetical protein [Escherichia coli]HEI3999855.1 hypothetical protein [Escherichia coli]
MASFTVRVELVGASSDDYNRLHEAMESRRYFREIQDGAGNWFYLPDAEYTAEKNASVRAVRDEVVAIAETIKKNPRVLVTQAADRSWHLIKKWVLIAINGYSVPATPLTNLRGAFMALHRNKRGSDAIPQIFKIIHPGVSPSHNQLTQCDFGLRSGLRR